MLGGIIKQPFDFTILIFTYLVVSINMLRVYIYIGGFIREACQFKKTRGRISATHLRLRWT